MYLILAIIKYLFYLLTYLIKYYIFNKIVWYINIVLLIILHFAQLYFVFFF